jgi:hypothetical protein
MTDHADILGPSSSPATDLLTGDLGKAQAEYPVVKLDSSNPHFKSRFASYQQCCESLPAWLDRGYVGAGWNSAA